MKSKTVFLAYLYFVFSNFFAAAQTPVLIDLEQSPSPFILNTQKIEIPGYPNACNASIIRWQGAILMSFRDIFDPIAYMGEGSGLAFSNIGLIWLDENFNPISEPQFLEFEADSSLPSMPEDARLIANGDILYLIYSDNKQLDSGIEGTRIYIAQLEQWGNQFWVVSQDCLSQFERDARFWKEKNWVPFVWENDLLLSYSILPHRILFPFIGQSTCETVYLTRGLIQWNWGTIRGGTPALQIDNTQYLGFFHSVLKTPSLQSDGLTVPHYFVGAYTFSNNPPFQITQISSSPIIATGFYSGIEYQPYWNPVKAVFPCGYIFDDNYIWLSYGRQDHEIWIAKMDRQGLLNSLQPVYTRRIP